MYFALFPSNISDNTSPTSVMSPSVLPNWSTNSIPSSTYVSSSTSTSFTPTYSWAHTVPTYMPWTTTIQTPVMQFTAPFPPDPCTSQTATSWELLHNLGTSQNRSNSHQHLKRKSDEVENLKPTKQYISEEKMVARLNELHISNSSVFCDSKQTPPVEKKFTEERRPIKSLEELEAMLSDESGEESDPEIGGLTLSPELKKLVRSDILLSESPLKTKEPSMALVLWQPPIGILPEKLKLAYSTDGNVKTDLTNKNSIKINNNDSTIDRNCTVTISADSSSTPEIKSNVPISILPEIYDSTDDMDL